MIEDKDGKVVVYFIGGSAGICPKCRNGNAMLDGGRHVATGRYVRMLECRDCGYSLDAGEYTEVGISYDAEAREYTGVAADGETVSLAPFDNPKTNRPDFSIMERYLADHPTPETW